MLDRDDDRKAATREMVEVIRDYLGARYRVATLRPDVERAARAGSRRLAPEEERRAGRGLARALRPREVRRPARDADDARGVLDDARALIVDDDAAR